MPSVRFRHLFEYSPCATLVIGADARIVECNRAACAALGHSRVELVGSPLTRWSAGGADDPAPHLRAALKGVVREFGARFTCGDGSVKRFTARVAPAGSADDGQGALVFLRETSEERLAGQVSTLQAVLESFPGQFSVLLDAQGVIRYARGLAGTHLQPDEGWIGRSFTQLLASDSATREGFAEMQRRSVSGQAWTGTLVQARRDGETFEAEVRSAPHRASANGPIVGTAVVGRYRDLPPVAESANGTGDQTSVEVGASTRTILVVDDEATVRELVRRVLERSGYEVIEAFSGRNALALLDGGEQPDAILTDLRMNGGTGYWLLRRLSRDHPGLVQRTVILTGDPSDALVAKVSHDTGCPVVRKPFEIRTLLQTLDRAVAPAA